MWNRLRGRNTITRRRFNRFPVQWRIPIHAKGIEGLWATVLEVGEGGMRIVVRHRLEVGDRLSFGLDDDGRGKPLEARVRNVRERDDGMFIAGIAWADRKHTLAKRLNALAKDAEIEAA